MATSEKLPESVNKALADADENLNADCECYRCDKHNDALRRAILAYGKRERAEGINHAHRHRAGSHAESVLLHAQADALENTMANKTESKPQAVCQRCQSIHYGSTECPYQHYPNWVCRLRGCGYQES